ncbi:MAG: aspartate--tRNA(Asn) ligase, partial [Thermoproteota archaeon]|nr:aspartate--tRNA(Asn) ligase [Thermoproteota archaeon]
DREGTVQITIPREKVAKELLEKTDSLQRRCSIGVKGVVRKTEMTPRRVEVVPDEIRVFAAAQHPLPLDVTGRTSAQIDVRLDARALDLCRRENQAVFRIQHVALDGIHNFLSGQGFIEVHTPRIIGSATEGGAALFPVSYFEQEGFLAQSPQLYKEQLTLSLEKVFEVGAFFRAEKSHTRRHLTEFISVDIEQAFATAGDVMQVLEKLMYHVCKTVKENCKKGLEFLGSDIELPRLPFKRFTYNQMLEELKEVGMEVPWGEDFSTLACKTLGKLHPYFYFITDWPSDSKPFYIKPHDDEPKLCGAFDLMWREMEIASGGTRVDSKEQLIERLKKQGLKPESFKYHLQAFDYGMPPHAGWAVGFERLMMMLTGKRNIREVALFPRDRFRLTP